MGAKNISALFVVFQGMLLCAVFAAEITSSAISRSAYLTTLKNKQLKGFVVKRFESLSRITCSQFCLKNTSCASTNFKLSSHTSKSDDKGTCELNKHDSSVIKENTNFQVKEGATFAMLRKGCLTTSSCLNGGVCLYDEEKQTYSCMCKPSWTGDACAVKLDACASHPCKNNGTCTDGINGYNCSCAPGFNGTQCEVIEGLPCFVKAYRMIFGQRTGYSYAIRANAVASNLSEFTVCLFLKLNETSPSGYQCVYSYAATGSTDGNTIYVCLSPRIEINVNAPGNGGTVTEAKIEDIMWHHICVTWENTNGDWQLYMDGKLRNNGTGLKKNHQIPSGGTVVIGQDQDEVGGGFQLADNFGPGEVTEVNLWKRVLSASDIAAQNANCHIAQAGLVHWWGQFKDGVKGDVKVVEP